MCFLNKVDVSRMLIRDGNRLFKLAPYQLKEILNYIHTSKKMLSPSSSEYGNNKNNKYEIL